MTMLDRDVSDRLVLALAECASQIDQTFSVAGAQLGQGLSVFESLKDSLGALSCELGGEELRAACKALDSVASDLEALRDKLPSETEALSAIGAASRAAAVTFERLLGSMRLICILARSARIEAASVTDRGEAFGAFADEIIELALRSQKTVEVCVREHDRLSALLASALAGQQAFQMRYGTTLSRLAEQLQQTLAAVGSRQRESIALTRDAAVHSGKIAVAAGGAIMALQSGDAIRQRLEHTLVALRLSAGEAGPGHDLRDGLSALGKEALSAAIGQLQERQLDATARALRHDVLNIEGALLVLADNTSPLMDLGRSLYGSAGSSSASFLQSLESDLTQAAEILGKCQIARYGVEQVTKTLTRSLDTLQETVSALETTVASILLIGTNASLRAARLGQGGRSLVVIAQEMKTAAAEIAKDAERVKPVFAAMQHAARSLSRQDRESDQIDTLNVTMDPSLVAIGASAQRLGDMLSKLTSASIDFAAVVGRARLMFSNATATADAIEGGSAILAQTGRELPDSDDDGSVASILASVIRPTYTMVAEREIHDAVLATLSLAPPTNAEIQIGLHQPEGTLDDFVF